MKTLRFLLIAVVIISASASAQTRLNLKTDSLIISNDSILNKLQNKLRLKSPFERENHYFFRPGNKSFQINPNLAVTPKQQRWVYTDPNSNMPILKPSYQSKMPVMKPDSTIHYHLQIKKIDRYIAQ
jgi:hypothetical protein